jgi:hypothetical protein
MVWVRYFVETTWKSYLLTITFGAADILNSSAIVFSFQISLFVLRQQCYLSISSSFQRRRALTIPVASYPTHHLPSFSWLSLHNFNMPFKYFLWNKRFLHSLNMASPVISSTLYRSRESAHYDIVHLFLPLVFYTEPTVPRNISLSNWLRTFLSYVITNISCQSQLD